MKITALLILATAVAVPQSSRADEPVSEKLKYYRCDFVLSDISNGGTKYLNRGYEEVQPRSFSAGHLGDLLSEVNKEEEKVTLGLGGSISGYDETGQKAEADIVFKRTVYKPGFGTAVDILCKLSLTGEMADSCVVENKYRLDVTCGPRIRDFQEAIEENYNKNRALNLNVNVAYSADDSVSEEEINTAKAAFQQQLKLKNLIETASVYRFADVTLSLKTLSKQVEEQIETNRCRVLKNRKKCKVITKIVKNVNLCEAKVDLFVPYDASLTGSYQVAAKELRAGCGPSIVNSPKA